MRDAQLQGAGEAIDLLNCNFFTDCISPVNAMLKRVFYVSKFPIGASDTNIRAVVGSSIVWNRRHDITGLLIASSKHFAEIIEGREENIDLALKRIQRDTNHHLIRIQTVESPRCRVFERWSMAYLLNSELSEEIDWLHMMNVSAHEKNAVVRKLAMACRSIPHQL